MLNRIYNKLIYDWNYEDFKINSKSLYLIPNGKYKLTIGGYFTTIDRIGNKYGSHIYISAINSTIKSHMLKDCQYLYHVNIHPEGGSYRLIEEPLNKKLYVPVGTLYKFIKYLYKSNETFIT